MRRKNTMDNFREIFSLRLARYLESKGFMIVGTRPDLKETGREVFLFVNTPQLRQAIDAYMS
ncbi:MAG: hypothetical protein IKW30_03040 [Lachnospiraceae bacterium]|nr:hypothetical protein [Lachnospiraceae bacterium]